MADYKEDGHRCLGEGGNHKWVYKCPLIGMDNHHDLCCWHTGHALSVFETKDSGQRQEFASGMVRDLQDGKPRFDLLLPDGVPYEDQMLTRWARLMERGQSKYGERNWEKAEGQEELARAKASAMRHFMQWMMGEKDEDHAAAVMFNITEAEHVTLKLEARKTPKNVNAGFCGNPDCYDC